MNDSFLLQHIVPQKRLFLRKNNRETRKNGKNIDIKSNVDTLFIFLIFPEIFGLITSGFKCVAFDWLITSIFMTLERERISIKSQIS